jgi:crotonobetainyl-CoA:carnitine CoA-transferase CaiB-like acyl-CoA transferase
VPSGDILTLGKALDSEQVKHRQTIVSIKEPKIGDIKVFNLSAKFSKTPATVDTPPPRLSQHTEEILTGLGYSKEEIGILREKAVI